jgi:hypothetical protein
MIADYRIPERGMLAADIRILVNNITQWYPIAAGAHYEICHIWGSVMDQSRPCPTQRQTIDNPVHLRVKRVLI